MAQRTVALCNGKFIGIETIYTVINGQQINIPEKLKELREKSRRNELFCPCGCGINLILVAGDKNLREQHFREKKGTGSLECKILMEDKTSVNSKIVLKCWLDDKLNISDVESRVPINTVEETKRKPEFTFLSRERKFAIRYWRTRANIKDDKLDILTGNLSGIQVIYIVDESNGGVDGQYPEALMKLQDRQKYCLLLSVKNAEYEKASLTAVFYDQDFDGRWKEISFVKAPLKDFCINNQNEVVYSGKSIDQIYSEAKSKFASLIEEERQRRIEAKENARRQREETEKRWLEYEEKRQEEKRQKEEEFRHDMEPLLLQQETPIRDAEGNRWIKCEFCGKIAVDREFNSYGGAGHVNRGTCKECSANNSAVKQRIENIRLEREKYDPNICPECGAVLKEKSGKYGKFMGCSNFPRCRYTRKTRS